MNDPDEMTQRDRVLEMLERGYCTQSEAAVLCGVSRQRIGQWVRGAGIHPIAARARHLRDLLARADQ